MDKTKIEKPLTCTRRPHNGVPPCDKPVGPGGLIDDKNRVYLCKDCWDDSCAYERDGRP